MFSVLIVDDDPAKSEAVASILLQVGGVTNDDVTCVGDIQSAQELLRRSRFDVLVLDVALPRRSGEEVRIDGGLELLREVLRRRVYRVPSQIIALTALDEVFPRAEPEFSSEAIILVKYDGAGGMWSEALVRLVERQLRAREAEVSERADGDASVCVVCALRDPELEALQRISAGWAKLNVDDDPIEYFEATVAMKNGPKRMIAAAAWEMGQASSASLAAKMIAYFRPRIVAMTGIAAGVPSRTNLGDVVVADPSWDYAAGKVVVEKGEQQFLQAPRQICLDPQVRAVAVGTAADPSFPSIAAAKFPGRPASRAPMVHVGPLATGPCVVASAEFRDRLTMQHRKLLAIDMETFGVYSAAEMARVPRPLVMSVKGISDLADSTKGDDSRHFAAHMAAETLLRLLASCPG